MPSSDREVFIRVSDLSGGWYTSIPTHLIPRNSFQVFENVEVSERFGSVKKRLGWTSASPTITASGDGSVTGLFVWYDNSLTKRQILSEGTKVYTFTSTTSTEIALPAGNGSITVNTPVNFAAFKNKLYIVNAGLNSPVWYDGTTTGTAGGSPPQNCKYVALHKSRLWLAGRAAAPSTVYFSALSNPDDWTSVDNAGSITINDGDGGVIKAILSVGDVLYVFKNTTVYAIFGSSPFNFEVKKVSDFGIVGERAYARFNNMAIFAGETHIYSISGRNWSELDIAIQNNYQGISDKSTIAIGRRRNQIRVAYKGSGSAVNNEMLVLDMVRGAWGLWTGIKANVFAQDGIDKLLFGRADAVHVGEMDNGVTDNGTNITAIVETPDLVDPGWEFEKHWREMYLYVRAKAGQSLTVKHYVDGVLQSDVLTLGIGTTDSGGNTRNFVYAREVFPDGTLNGRMIRLRIEDATADQSLELFGYSVSAYVDERAREV